MPLLKLYFTLVKQVNGNINSLRTFYSKELKKNSDSKKSGAALDDTYSCIGWVEWAHFFEIDLIICFKLIWSCKIEFDAAFFDSENTTLYVGFMCLYWIPGAKEFAKDFVLTSTKLPTAYQKNHKSPYKTSFSGQMLCLEGLHSINFSKKFVQANYKTNI